MTKKSKLMIAVISASTLMFFAWREFRFDGRFTLEKLTGQSPSQVLTQFGWPDNGDMRKFGWKVADGPLYLCYHGAWGQEYAVIFADGQHVTEVRHVWK